MNETSVERAPQDERDIAPMLDDSWQEEKEQNERNMRNQIQMEFDLVFLIIKQ